VIIGQDVPWNAAWTGEEEFSVRPCRYVQGKLAIWQKTAQGIGKPIFAEPHTVRQRMSVAKMLCTVCGKPTEVNERWMFPIGQEMILKGEHFRVTTESPVHKKCADLSAERCPILRERNLKPIRFPENYYLIASLVGGIGVEKDFGLKIPADKNVIGHLKIAFPENRLTTQAGYKM
jgi:hypothetical protein